MKKITLWLLFMLPVFIGCFDDKGNYNYKDLNEIEAENIGYYYTVNEGDGLKIEPKLHFKKDSINVNLKHEWHIGDTIIEGEKLDITVYPGPLGYTRCQYVVTDLDDNLPYFFTFNVNHIARYQECWLILSEKDGKSFLSLVKENHKLNEEGQIISTTYAEELGVYKQVNGEDLGTEPIKLVEHFTGKTSGDALAEVWVLQNGGKGTVLLNGASLKRETYLYEEFIGNQLPNNFRIKDAMFFSNTHYVLSEEGKMYSRLTEDQASFHAGRFDRNPMARNEVTLLIPSCFYTLDGGLFYEKSKSNYLYIYDYRYDSDLTQSGAVKEIDFNQYPNNFTPLNKMGDRHPIFCNFRDGGYYAPTYFFSILYDESEQKYYRQYFELNYDSREGFTIKPEFEKLFPGNLLTHESVMTVGRMVDFFFFSAGVNQDQLYWITTTDSDDQPRLYNDFKGDRITSISIAFENEVGERMGVGTASGKFYIFDISREVLNSGQPKILYEMQGNPGDIKDVIYKVATSNKFWYGCEGR